ncbi:YihY/virulence factor BrkB family protein, partial [Jatrophihabitans sp. YIM 134969]
MDKLKARFAELRKRYPWLDHVIRAYGQYSANQGDHQAAAITFFSFLSIFPILLLAVSVLGYVLVGNDDLRDSVIRSITENVPGNFITEDTLNTVINARGGTGVVGLVTLALTGTSWVDNIRSAMESVWGREPSKRSFLATKGGDLGVLVILGITLAVSFAITGLGTTLTGLILSPIGLDDTGWAAAVALVLGVLLAIAWDTAAFSVVLQRLPRVEVSRRSALQGSLLAAVGFEIIKIGGSYYLGSLSGNPAVVGFGAPVGLLILINLLSRYLLFCAAWTSTFDREMQLAAVPADAGVDTDAGPSTPIALRPDGPSPAAVGAGLVGAGAALGA